MKKVKVNYKGNKKEMPIDFPIGIKSKGGVTETKFVPKGGSVEMGEEDAKKLVTLDSHNFEIDGQKKASTGMSKEEVLAEANPDMAIGEVAEGEEEAEGGEPEVESYTPAPKAKKPKTAKTKKAAK